MKKRSNDIKAESAGNAAGDDDKEEILPRYREILYLSYLLDYNDAKISRILGKPVSTVHSRKKAALRRLRELLGDPYGE